MRGVEAPRAARRRRLRVRLAEDRRPRARRLAELELPRRTRGASTCASSRASFSTPRAFRTSRRRSKLLARVAGQRHAAAARVHREPHHRSHACRLQHLSGAPPGRHDAGRSSAITRCAATIGVERTFFGHLFVSPQYGAQGNVPFDYIGKTPDALTLVISYVDVFAYLDFRDDPLHTEEGHLHRQPGADRGRAIPGRRQRRPRPARGPGLRAAVEEALRLRVAASIGFLFPFDYGKYAEINFRNPGPSRVEGSARDYQILFFRGFYAGGPASNRGYPLRGIGPYDVIPYLSPAGQSISASGCNPNDKGCSLPTGGRTLWELSAEVRIIVAGPFSTAVFCDAADVSPFTLDIRLDRPHLSCGAGARYDTPVGPIRLDIGYRIPGAPVPRRARRSSAPPDTLFGRPDRARVRHRGGLLMRRSRAEGARPWRARSLGIGAVFAGAVVGSVMTPRESRANAPYGASVANDALSTLFLGRLVIGDVQELTLGAVGPRPRRAGRGLRSRRPPRDPREGHQRTDRSPQARHVAPHEGHAGGVARRGPHRRRRGGARYRRERRHRDRARVLSATERDAEAGHRQVAVERGRSALDPQRAPAPCMGSRQRRPAQARCRCR